MWKASRDTQLQAVRVDVNLHVQLWIGIARLYQGEEPVVVDHFLICKSWISTASWEVDDGRKFNFSPGIILPQYRLKPMIRCNVSAGRAITLVMKQI